MFSPAWFRHLTLRRGTAAARKARQLTLTLERLEDRWVPSTASVKHTLVNAGNHKNEVPALTTTGQKAHIVKAGDTSALKQTTLKNFHLVDKGGPVLSNVEVQAVFLGSYWKTAAGKKLAHKIDGFLSHVTSSPLMGILSQYDVGPGTLAGDTILPTKIKAGSTLNDAKIQSTLQKAVKTGTLDAPNANTLFAVFTPPKVHVKLGKSTTAHDLLGYHSTFTGKTGGDKFTASYAVVAHPTGNATVAGLKSFQQLTGVAGQELAACVTNPNPAKPAWVEPHTGAEVVTPGAGQFCVVDGYTLPAVWSNPTGGIVTPGDPDQTSSITVSVPSRDATTGKSLSGIIARFQDTAGTGDASAYQALVDWGDGTTSVGVITASSATVNGVKRVPQAAGDLPSVFTVAAEHIYASPGGYALTVTVTRNDGVTGADQGKVSVQGDTSDATDLKAFGRPVLAVAGKEFTATPASFIDMGALLGGQTGDPSNYKASIDWGDGTTSDGTVSLSDANTPAGPLVKLTPRQEASLVIIKDGGPGLVSAEFFVQGTHTYAKGGGYAVTVTITRNDGATVTALSKARVEGVVTSTLTATGVDVSAPPGVEFTATVANITDLPDPGMMRPFDANGNLGHTYKASIDWGDGTTSDGTVTVGFGDMMKGPAGGEIDILPVRPIRLGEYQVQGTHTYAKEDSFTIVVTITRDDGVTATTKSTATVKTVDATELTATGLDVSAVAGVEANLTVATLHDASASGPIWAMDSIRPFDPGHTYKATIDWGDGTSTDGAVVPAIWTLSGMPSFAPGPISDYLVQGTHTYDKEGSFSVAVTVTRDDGATVSTKSTATVEAATVTKLEAKGLNISTMAGVEVKMPVATFSDHPDPTTGTTGANGERLMDPALRYKATIDWGDGTTSDGTIEMAYWIAADDPTGAVVRTEVVGWPLVGGQYLVEGAHAYTKEGSYPISVTITRNDGVTASTTSTATVEPAPVTKLEATGVDVGAYAGVETTQTVATLSEVLVSSSADGGGWWSNGDPSTRFKASIDWGDGTTSVGTILFDYRMWAPGQGMGDNIGIARPVQGGQYMVQGTHTYDKEGSFTVTVNIMRVDGVSTSTTSTATVKTAPATTLTATGLDVRGRAGVEANMVVASFTDKPDPTTGQTGPTGRHPLNPASRYKATINWGDGTTSEGNVTPALWAMVVGLDGSGTFYVDGTHTYDKEGSYSISVTITRDDGATASATSTATVKGASATTLTARGMDVGAYAGVETTVGVATFSDLPDLTNGKPGADGSWQVDPSHQYKAQIDWGDGSTSEGSIELAPWDMVSPLGGQYLVQGTHTYVREGSFAVTVTIVRDDGTTVTTSSTATVKGAATTVLSATGVDVKAYAGVETTSAVARFSDKVDLTRILKGLVNGELIDPTARYKASIDWGDGSTSDGSIQIDYQTLLREANAFVGYFTGVSPLPSGAFLVQGTHTYADAGKYAVTVTITRDDGATATTTSTAEVETPPEPGTLTVNAQPFSATAGTPVFATVATFSGSDSSDDSSKSLFDCLGGGGYRASVDWGDGSTSDALVLPSSFAGPIYTVGKMIGERVAGTMPGLNGGGYFVLGEHTYAEAGSYTVTVKVAGSDGAAGSGTTTATVKANDGTGFIGPPIIGSLGSILDWFC